MLLITERNTLGIVLGVYKVQIGVSTPQLCMLMICILEIFLAEH